MKNLIPLLLLALPTFTFAYETGKDFCGKNPVSGTSRFHQIVDKDFPDENLRIHSYVKKAFNKDLPTILFFTGGPGASPRSSEFDLEKFNIIFFEQRGMGCSRPDRKDIFLNPKFYASSKTIRDARKILNDYKVQKAIIYGHSYGTVPATMFASQFPEMTLKVILEGIIFRGDVGIWKSEIKRIFLQDIYDNLDEELKKKVIHYSNSGKVPANWYSVVGTMMSYLDNGAYVYKNFLGNVLSMEEEFFVNLVTNFYAPKGFEHVSPEEASDGEVVFGMITCKELSGNTDVSNSYLRFDNNNKLVWDKGSVQIDNYCKPLGLKSAHSVSTDMSRYPVKVPVVYLAGEYDGATDLNQAKLHAMNVAQGRKSFYVLSEGGHLPNLGALRENRQCHDEEDCQSLKAVKTQVKMFEQILDDKLTDKILDGLNEELPFRWTRLK